MNAGQDPIAPFRGRLLGLAYRMLGSRADADDVLQDAYLRIRDAADIANLEAYLVTTVTRLCIDRLKSAQVRRETYIGPWLPEPVLDAEMMSPQTALELAEDLSFALMLVLERLSPPERAAFLLHDIFDIGFAEIAVVLDRSEASCRQLASRARRAVKAHRPATPVPIEQQGALLASFASALRHRPRMINGALGVVSYLGDALEQVLSLHIDGDRIAAIYMVRNPHKLAHL